MVPLSSLVFLNVCLCCSPTSQALKSFVPVQLQVIYDLLEKSSGHLELREDPQHGVIVAGLRSIKVLALALALIFVFSICIRSSTENAFCKQSSN